MAIHSDRSRPADPGTQLLLRKISDVASRRSGPKAFAERLFGQVRDFSRRIGLYEFLTYGPLIRLVAKTLMRRIIFANLIGLVILLIGIFYLGQYHAWLIEAKRDSLRAQGEVIAAAIAASATREKDSGRIVITPDMLPEIEGARALLRDENIAALQLSIPPERVAPLFKGGLLPADIRARVYAKDGVLIVDSDQLLSRGQLSTPDEQAAGQRQSGEGIRTNWTRFMHWLMRRQVRYTARSAPATAWSTRRCALPSPVVTARRWCWLRKEASKSSPWPHPSIIGALSRVRFCFPPAPA
jgi:hypothetical protein